MYVVSVVCVLSWGVVYIRIGLGLPFVVDLVALIEGFLVERDLDRFGEGAVFA
jgi:hypothetical protein